MKLRGKQILHIITDIDVFTL